MGKKKKSNRQSEDKAVKILIFATAIANLITALIKMINS